MAKDEPEEHPKSEPQRKPYIAPRIEESGRFETLILNCALEMNNQFCMMMPTPPSMG